MCSKSPQDHPCGVQLFVIVLVLLCACFNGFAAFDIEANQSAWLSIDASPSSAKRISKAMFGISFEEINHAGAGGLWAELVNNSGFEAGGENIPSNIYPWTVLGDASQLIVSTDRSSCFERNKVALKMKVLCDSQGANICPNGGVGVYNPGFWGMNIKQGKAYRVIMYVRSLQPVDISISLRSADGSQILATSNIVSSEVTTWTKTEVMLEASGSDPNSRLQLTTTRKGVIWLDQVSAMPVETVKGHGFRNDLYQMLSDLKPGFIRFPGGSFVDGGWLRNSFNWKATVGPWEERPGHFNDVWGYWTDDRLGLFEFLQLAEDLGAMPIWVFNNGVGPNDEVNTSRISPFVQEILDGIEFSRGDSNSTWGSVRAAMGHPQPFDLRYVAIGNQDCGRFNYRGNYRKFYNAIKSAYPDIQVVSNCDGSTRPLDHPADFYDIHVYGDANSVFGAAHMFDNAIRKGPKAFVSEYAVTGNNAGRGNLLSALAQAGFLIGLERNSDVVEMASNAPLFVNDNDRSFNPDAIVFDSSRVYGTPCYYMQQFFRESNGATLLNSTINPSSLAASAVLWRSPQNGRIYLRIKVVNMGSNMVNLKILTDKLDLDVDTTDPANGGSTKTVMTATSLMDENSFNQPNKVFPVKSSLKGIVGKNMVVPISPYSLTGLDLLTKNTNAIAPLVQEFTASVFIF
ncbi:OLC1v1038287C1 [Oldenlandia corymbosa var. corymbosa]|uniref:non-reducing end alpha-L-arabinofuranosidase n=1 Tax=Oldenlandia corymbosa var. corymbosa TaxID=529605 RepID=A0AAV1D370_OLDCO|nr:OLC1v1038287C1 [Oldenlandia corymbosa var. corymbosa]